MPVLPGWHGNTLSCFESNPRRSLPICMSDSPDTERGFFSGMWGKYLKVDVNYTTTVYRYDVGFTFLCILLAKHIIVMSCFFMWLKNNQHIMFIELFILIVIILLVVLVIYWPSK